MSGILKTPPHTSLKIKMLRISFSKSNTMNRMMMINVCYVDRTDIDIVGRIIEEVGGRWCWSENLADVVA